ncbi:hypothetical protein A8926_7528 [Saccharopolyspora spinosa]|uniref:Uncharacterized protein n=1 Tax=Saccharopolyspora spinosa TaxID=60894 RepID=A0A2N3Y8V9_SACSN|nr:hypothetical protein A8926_7528 [Saccharopolyspora spinosa]
MQSYLPIILLAVAALMAIAGGIGWMIYGAPGLENG